MGHRTSGIFIALLGQRAAFNLIYNSIMKVMTDSTVFVLKCLFIKIFVVKDKELMRGHLICKQME